MTRIDFLPNLLGILIPLKILGRVGSIVPRANGRRKSVTLAKLLLRKRKRKKLSRKSRLKRPSLPTSK
jgi:predicted nucleotidyltransferase